MSSSGEEGFDIHNVSASDSDSEGYVPVAKVKTKVAPKTNKPTKKAAADSKKIVSGASKKKQAKVLKEIDENGTDNNMDIDSASGSDEEAHSLKNKTVLPVQVRGKDKTATEMYQKLTQLEHILKRPDSYIGSVEAHTQNMWVYDSENKRMTNREITYVPGFFKIVDEILVNAADNKINDPNMSTLKVNIDVEQGTISVYNDGKGIPIELHATEKIYIPELIFGHLLTSSNYDDDEKKLTGGRNGYGAKLANIYSQEFTVETADKNTSQKYKQTWTENMTKVGKMKITKTSGSQEYTRVTFRPDLQRFGMTKINEDTVALLKKRVYDMAGTVKDIKVFLNDERIKVKDFEQYVKMYISSAAAQAAEVSGGAAQVPPKVIYERINSRWEVAFAVSDGTPQQISFANSISTIKGGTHVLLIQDQIAKNLIASITKKNKAATVKPAQIKNHMWIFVNALIENPTFDSQTKETLTLTASKFGGSKPTLSEDFLKKVSKTPIVENILSWAKFKADQQIKKTDGSKRSRLTGLTKLSDANNAGGRNASKCTLILTEGDSAKALAIAGLSVAGRDNFGVFPLRGKLLNVREANHSQIIKNEEIQNIKKIMGLQHNKEYNSVSDLRYGSLMIMTDQDHDGSHIKGLLINFLDHFYPSLLRIPGFLVEFITPIVRVTKGNERINFYTIPEYEQWLEGTHNTHRYTHKYYKGLGTSTDEDARYYFRQMEKHMIPFTPSEPGDRDLIELAFSKKKIEERKEWLRQFKPGTYLNHDVEEIPISDFINKELILFSMADNIRSIPSVVDGLKPGQRKVLFGTFKKKLKSEIKVQQLVGYVSEHAQYHHGEASLTSTIVALAQDFVGSNNVNLLEPSGQYGTREKGGKDHASARYIHTMQSSLARVVFHPADDPLLNYQTEDGKSIEPEWYMPILPVVLLNGVEGIGTGWSTNIPNYNPVDVVANLKRLMAGEEQVPMLPWWRGFAGEVKKIADHKYEAYGKAEQINATTIEISELPVHKWTIDFKAELEALCGEKGDGILKDYKEHSTTTTVSFTLTMSEKDVEKVVNQGLLGFFKLSTKISTSNMMCFDAEGRMKKYDSPETIIADFYTMRLAYYQKRKDFLSNELETQLEKLTNQVRFVQMIIKKELVVSGRKKVDLVAELRKRDFKAFPKIQKAKLSGETEEAAEDEDEVDNKNNGSTDFDYLLGMPIWSLTHEKVEKLLQQRGDKEAELVTLLKRTPVEIWTEDLNNFLTEWDRACTYWVNVHGGNDKKPNKRKQATLKTRKSLGGDRDDSADEFKPTKAVAKQPKKPSAPKDKPPAAPKTKHLVAPTVEGSDGEAAIIPVAKKASSMTKVESDSDVEMVDGATKDKGKGKAAPKRKRYIPSLFVATSSDIPHSDNFDDDGVKPATKKTKPNKQAVTSDNADVEPKPKKPAAGPSKAKPRTVSNPKKPSVKKKQVVSDLEDEDSLDAIPPPPPREAAPKRTARAQVKKYIEVESDIEDVDDDDVFVVSD
ncbi:DNA topoisomerase II [Hysterangium stoloniferum]|nr:DNA topoisomerase II [Hysterangium stoloniferum]